MRKKSIPSTTSAPNPPTWYFIDFENHPHLPAINFGKTDKIILVLGHQQTTIKTEFAQRLIKLKSTMEVEMIKVEGVSPNNADFHISFELGEHHKTAATNIAFVVVSKDKGFTNVIAYINKKGRQCKRIE